MRTVTNDVADLILRLAWPLVAGAALGLFYFGLMWLTVNQLQNSRAPVALLMISFFGRLAVTLYGFYLVSGRQGDRLIAALAGFVAARLVMVAYLRPTAPRAGGKGGGSTAPDA
jgi:F1F0 ATPase subunit 2